MSQNGSDGQNHDDQTKRSNSTLRGERPDPTVMFVIDHLEDIKAILASGRTGEAHVHLKGLLAALRRTIGPGAA